MLLVYTPGSVFRVCGLSLSIFRRGADTWTNAAVPRRVKMQIFIKRMTGKVITIDASDGDTILLIKEKFHDKEGLLPAQQCLLFAGRELEDDKMLSDYSIQKEAMLNVIERVFAPPLEAVAAAASTGEIVAAFARIAASVAAEPPTTTISKVALIAACKTWREAHPGAWRGWFRVRATPPSVCALHVQHV